MATILHVVFSQHDSEPNRHHTITVGTVDLANTKSLRENFLDLFPSATAYKNVATADGSVSLGVHLVSFLIYYGMEYTRTTENGNHPQE